MTSVPTTTTLEMLALVRSSYAAHPQFYSAEQIKLTVDNELEQPEFDESGSRVHGLCTFKLSGESGDTVLLRIEAAYLVIYGNVDHQGSSERAIEFLRKVGRMAVYPYFRSLVAMTSAEGQLEIPVLPAVTIAAFESGGISIMWGRTKTDGADSHEPTQNAS